MGVDVEGDGNRRMPQHLTHYLRIYPSAQQQGRTGVAQVMEPHVWQRCLLQQPFEGAHHVAGEEGRSGVAAKDGSWPNAVLVPSGVEVQQCRRSTWERPEIVPL